MEYVLNNAPHNKNLIIKSVDILDKTIKKRLEEIGFFDGEKIAILCQPTKSNTLIEIRGIALALDNNICKQVVVDA